ncbi:MAG: helix-turn-helix transcriptional regulator, partial [Microlunatus sp.]|nr:helix-turn-helix transcriptional regulator [Microlunatus sp.]
RGAMVVGMSPQTPDFPGPALTGDDLRHALSQTRDAWLSLERGDEAASSACLAAQRRAAAGTPLAELIALTGSALIGALTGRLRHARSDLAAADDRLKSLGVAGLRPHWEQAALVCDWMAGDWVSAESRSAQLAALPPAPQGLTLSVRTEVLREAGRIDQLPPLRDRLQHLPPTALIGWAIAGTRSDPQQALADLRAAAGCERIGMLPLVLYRIARHSVALDDRAAARAAYEQLLQLQRADPLTRILCRLTEAAAMGKPAAARWAQEQAEAQGLRPLIAESLGVQAMLGSHPDPLWRAARQLWIAIGATVRADRIAELLGDPDQPRLAPRELELVRHVRIGLSNREIAAAMHLSVKSVEAYLTRVYEKTGCASRVELALAAAQGRVPGADIAMITGSGR